eukprot:Gb_37947 [translate_table: standard]
MSAGISVNGSDTEVSSGNIEGAKDIASFTGRNTSNTIKLP